METVELYRGTVTLYAWHPITDADAEYLLGAVPPKNWYRGGSYPQSFMIGEAYADTVDGSVIYGACVNLSGYWYFGYVRGTDTPKKIADSCREIGNN